MVSHPLGWGVVFLFLSEVIMSEETNDSLAKAREAKAQKKTDREADEAAAAREAATPVNIQMLRVTKELDGVQVICERDVALDIYDRASVPVSIVPAKAYEVCHSVVVRMPFPKWCYTYGESDRLDFRKARGVATRRLARLFQANIEINPDRKIVTDEDLSLAGYEEDVPF